MVKKSEQQENSNVLSESISALVDAEQSELELRRILKGSSAEVNEQWRRYHLIGASLRGELNALNRVDISSGIIAAIENEPSLSSTARPKRLQVLMNGLGKTAIAASVMLAVLVGVQYAPLGVNGGDDLVATNTVSGNAAPVAQNAEVIPAGFSAPRLNARVVSTDPNVKGSIGNASNAPFIVPMPDSSRPVNDPELQAYLNKLLYKHVEHSSQSGGIGVLPYARVVYPDVDK